MTSPQGSFWASSMHGILETDRLLIKAAQGSKRVSTKNQIDSVSLFYDLSSEVTLCHSAMVTSPLEFWERQHKTCGLMGVLFRQSHRAPPSEGPHAWFNVLLSL